MKKFNVVIIVVMYVIFFNNIYATKDIDIDVTTNKNKLYKNDEVQVKVVLKNLDKSISIKKICGYIDYDKAVFENVTNADIYINNRNLNDSYNETSKRIFANTSLKLGNNANIITIKLKVKENVKVNSGYVSLKQLYLIDEKYEKTEFESKSIKFNISNNYIKEESNNYTINMENYLSGNNIIENVQNQIKIPIVDNFSKILSIPLEGTGIIACSFLAVILFRFLVAIIYKSGVKFSKRCKRASQIRRMDKIFKSLDSKIID